MDTEKWDRARESIRSQLVFTLQIPPASLQAKRKNKNLVKAAIHEHTKTCPFVLTGDVGVEITWGVCEKYRYESHISPDIDNIVKPMFDALIGPEGILIDDGQVQFFSCKWVDSPENNQWVRIQLDRQFEDEWLLKENMAFIHMGGGLCYPLYLCGVPAELVQQMIDVFTVQLETRDKLYEMTGDYYLARSCMSVQRPFYRSRIKGFEVIEKTHVLKLIESGR